MNCSVTVVAVPCDPVEALSCMLVGGGVSLSWSNGDSYSSIDVFRNGALIGTLPGSATFYTDLAVPPGSYTYTVEGMCAGGGASSGVNCDVDVPCDPVLSLTCNVLGNDVELGWFNGDVYSQIRIYRDTILIATLGGGATAYTDFGVPAGSHTYEVVAECVGGLDAIGVDCTISVDCMPVTSLTCTVIGGVDVSLGWTNGDAYGSINVYRDAALIATVSGSATSYFDVGPGPGSHTYLVEGVCGSPAPGVSCGVTIGGGEPEFSRGDCNADGSFNIADAIFGLDILFGGMGTIAPCQDSCDANDDGGFNIADNIYMLTRSGRTATGQDELAQRRQIFS